MRIAVLGGGFVGVTTATVLAEQGHHVQLVEPFAERRQLLDAGTVPFFEPGLSDAFQTQRLETGRIEVHGALAGTAPQECVFVCVGTPSDAEGRMDTSQVHGAARDVGRAAVDWPEPFTVIVKSTVVPGTTRRIVWRALHETLGDDEERYGVAMNPEFLREGNALADARRPDRVVYGTEGPVAAQHLAELYADMECPVRATDLETAETCKYAANALLATKVGFANELARYAEAVGTDIDVVLETVGLDHRIAPAFLQAGPGFGGSCFPKDLSALRASALDHGVELGIVDAVLRSNETQPLHVVHLIEQSVGNLGGKRIVLLGAAFKPETDDVRETRTLPVHQALVAAGAHVTVHDPMASGTYAALVAGSPLASQITDDLDHAIAGADLLVLMTHWDAYVRLDPATIAGFMRNPSVVDTRRAWDEAAWHNAGFDYRALGRKAQEPELGSEPSLALPAAQENRT